MEPPLKLLLWFKLLLRFKLLLWFKLLFKATFKGWSLLQLRLSFPPKWTSKLAFIHTQSFQPKPKLPFKFLLQLFSRFQFPLSSRFQLEPLRFFQSLLPFQLSLLFQLIYQHTRSCQQRSLFQLLFLWLSQQFYQFILSFKLALTRSFL